MLPELIRTARLTLRPFSLGDSADVFAYSTSDPNWSRYQRMPLPYTPRAAEQFVAELVLRDPSIKPAWAMTREDRVIGIVSMPFHSEHRIAVLGYGVHASHWGKGLAREAAQAVIDQAFQCFEQLKRVRAHTSPMNSRSIRVLEKLGFTHEGTLRSNQYERGEFHDEAIFGMLREEWSPATA